MGAREKNYFYRRKFLFTYTICRIYNTSGYGKVLVLAIFPILKKYARDSISTNSWRLLPLLPRAVKFPTNAGSSHLPDSSTCSFYAKHTQPGFRLSRSLEVVCVKEANNFLELSLQSLSHKWDFISHL